MFSLSFGVLPGRLPLPKIKSITAVFGNLLPASKGFPLYSKPKTTSSAMLSIYVFFPTLNPKASTVGLACLNVRCFNSGTIILR